MIEKQDIDEIKRVLERIAESLENLAPSGSESRGQALPEGQALAFIWQGFLGFQPVPKVECIPLHLLKGLDHQQDTLINNTRLFAQGLPANNALLWGARGTGKSSLIKAVHAHICPKNPLVLVEIHREDLATLPELLSALRGDSRRFIVFCDDLTFEKGETSYKSLKAILEGGLEGRPDNVIFYATSNRRHLMARDMIDNEAGSAINPSEAIEEKVSLSDRFGLWLGFHPIDQDTYLAMVNSYADALNLDKGKQLEKDALAWAMARGGRSGRVAWQFIIHAAGVAGISINMNSLSK